MTEDERRNFFARVKEDGVRFANQLGDAGVQASIVAGTATGEFVTLAGELGKVRKTVEGTAESEQAASDKSTAAVAEFGEAVNEARGEIQKQFLDSKIFTKITYTISKFAMNITKPL